MARPSPFKMVVESRRDELSDWQERNRQRQKATPEFGANHSRNSGLRTRISQRTMGPAPARPVLRGLGGDRLRLVLEDGERTGDLSPAHRPITR
ncbi:MAG: hypothetical protein R3C26_05215 [Calditrichia bacterium]